MPKPVQAPHPPVIIGGAAKPRSLALAARYATEYNNLYALPEQRPSAGASWRRRARRRTAIRFASR